MDPAVPSPAGAGVQNQTKSPDPLRIHVSSPANPRLGTEATHRPAVDTFRLAAENLASVGAFLSDRAALLLLIGFILAALAQLGLYFSVELNARAPIGYLFLLTIGVVAFALGSAGLWLRRTAIDDDSESLSLAGVTQTSWATIRSPLGLAGWVFGLVALFYLLAMLASGSESGNAVYVWVFSFAALALPFVPVADVAAWHVRSRLVAWLRQQTWDIAIVVALIAAFLVINLHDLQDWYYSAIGDEYLFYEHARRVVYEGIVRPFGQEGVYNIHPVMNSVFQAGVMRVFDADYLGWKFSETLNAAITIPAVYLLGHTLGGRRAAIVAAAVFASSHYLFAFAHTGYNNLSPLPVATWAIAVFVLGWKRQSPLLMYTAGLIAGLGFYTHYGARAVLPIIALFSLTMGNPRRFTYLWPLALGFAITVIPTFVVEQEAVLTRMFGQVVGGYSEVVTGSTGQRFLDNAVLNLPAFNYNSTVHTYVYGALMDPVSGLLAVLGVAFAIGHLKDPRWRLLLIWFAVAMFMSGILSPYPHVAVTRLLFAVPPLALLAGMLAGRLWEAIPFHQLRFPERYRLVTGVAVVATLLPVILALNLWQFWHVTPSMFPHSREAVALGAFRSEDCGGDLEKAAFVGNAVGEGSLMRQVLSSMYPDGPLPGRISHSELAIGSGLPDPLPECFVFLNPYADDALRLQQELARRYPDGWLLPFANPSGTTTVAIFAR